jgi:hypothetical protein
MAQHFLDECEVIFKRRNSNGSSTSPNEKSEEAMKELNVLRQQFYTAVEASWDAFVNHTKVEPETLQAVSRVSRKMVKKARTLVNELYPFCGMIAADPSSAINRIWRDIYTGSQHSLLNGALS